MITWKHSKGQCGLRNRLGLVLNLLERKRNRVMEDDEFGGIFFLSSKDVCFVMAGSERGALQGGSKLLDSPEKHIYRARFLSHRRSIYKTQSV
jgi:hypothetical protein